MAIGAGEDVVNARLAVDGPASGGGVAVDVLRSKLRVAVAGDCGGGVGNTRRREEDEAEVRRDGVSRREADETDAARTARVDPLTPFEGPSASADSLDCAVASTAAVATGKMDEVDDEFGECDFGAVCSAVCALAIESFDRTGVDRGVD